VRYVRNVFARDRDAKQKDQYAITRGRIECLAETLVGPTHYLQRFVEQVAFLPKGGQQWTRTLQARIPEAAESGRSWHIVSLGQYERRRFPDLVATGADGARLNLLTRRQHGIALTRVTLLRHVYSLPEVHYTRLKEKAIRPVYNDFHTALYIFFTTAGGTDDPRATAHRLTSQYQHILRRVGIGADASESRINDFATDLAQATGATRYLCWVEAEPNEVVSIRVLYTAKDANQELEQSSFRGSFTKIREGIFARKSDKRREIWANWYRQFGLAPINYAYDIPNRITASYYFTIDPPSASDVTYLDWEISNSLEDQEIDAGFFSGHIHGGNKPRTLPDRDGTIRAYIRCAPHHHKQILGVTLINCALVYLLAKGLLLGKLANSAQGALLAAPPVLIAYLVQQQRHYYAHALRRQRAILWIYLSISVGFLLAVAFSHKELGHQNPGWFITTIALFLAASSVGVFFWYLPLGYSYQNVVSNLAQRKLRKLEETQKTTPKLGDPTLIVKFLAKIKRRLQFIGPPLLWRCYEDTVHKYCTCILRTAVVAMIVVTAALGRFWTSLEDHYKPARKSAAHMIYDVGSFTMTTWPSANCKGCNINVRFVPSTELNK
jgi:hypothetical protein